jgi:hypothetical protein
MSFGGERLRPGKRGGVSAGPSAQATSERAFSARRARAHAAAAGGADKTLEQLVRVLDARPQQFRLQHFSAAGDRGSAIVSESALDAADVETAVRTAVSSPWPAGAIGLRLLDREGCQVFEQLKADWR